MAIVNFLASIFGLSFIVVGLSLLISQKEVKKIIESFENETTLFLFGILSFIIGTAMLLNYNVWAKDWKVVVTILGWVTLVKGLISLFLPETTIKYLKKAKDCSWLSYGLVAVVVVGCVLVYFGFTA